MLTIIANIVQRTKNTIILNCDSTYFYVTIAAGKTGGAPYLTTLVEIHVFNFNCQFQSLKFAFGHGLVWVILIYFS